MIVGQKGHDRKAGTSRVHVLVSSIRARVNGMNTNKRVEHEQIVFPLQLYLVRERRCTVGSGKTRLATVIHVLRYLRGTCDKGIQYHRGTKLKNTFWSGGYRLGVCHDISHTGFILMFNGGLISWKPVGLLQLPPSVTRLEVTKVFNCSSR